MNRARHKVYKLEFDVWEPLSRASEREMELVVQFIKNNTSHCGNVRIYNESEEILK